MRTTRTIPTHQCDLDEPTQPCCWVARRAEFDRVQQTDAVRIAAYGGTCCKLCGKIYAVDLATLTIKDHAPTCKPLSNAQHWA